jgi:trk system potassium uptake protein TrkA
MRRFAVIGLGEFGCQVARSLAGFGAEVLAIDIDLRCCDSLKSIDGIHPMCLDACDEEALRASGIESAEVAIVAIRQPLDASLRAATNLRRLAIPRIIARAVDGIHADILERVGCDTVVFPDQEMGRKVAGTAFAPDLRAVDDFGHGLQVAHVDAQKPLWNRRLDELSLLSRFEVQVIAIKRPDNSEVTLPRPTHVIEQGDVLVVAGSPDAINAFLSL